MRAIAAAGWGLTRWACAALERRKAMMIRVRMNFLWYAELGPEYRDRTFVVVGPSHYGEADHFGLTRKPFITPLGEARTNVALVDQLAAAAPGAVNMEDYC